jgi:hypothetical protein
LITHLLTREVAARRIAKQSGETITPRSPSR